MTRSTQRSDASADHSRHSGLQMVAGMGGRRDLEVDLQEGRFITHRNLLGKPRTAGEMMVQTNSSQYSNFSLQQGLVRLIGHRETR